MIPWTHRLMFWKPCRKCFAKVRTFSAQGAKITENQSFFFKKNPQSLDLDSPSAVLTPLGESFFSQKPKIIWSKYWEDWKTITFPKKNFSICFIGHLNCGFWNRIVNCLLNAIKNSPQMTKFVRSRQKNYIKIIIFKKCFFLKNVPWTRRMNFWKTHRNYFCHKLMKSFAQNTTNFPSRHERY